MDASTQTKRVWGPLELSVLTGKGIDIGCGKDPVMPDVKRFDLEDGDANEITKYVHEQFDYVYSSHCLEHMYDPRKTILDWWSLVKVGGHLFFMVPDEDLYEQGVFPSRFNPDHKATFTISKAQSWSPVSINVLDLVKTLPNGEVVSLVLQDQGYDRRIMKHGLTGEYKVARFLLRACNYLRRKLNWNTTGLVNFLSRYGTIDQTRRPEALAQIQCIVKKTG